MTATREDLELYVSGNYDGDVAALEHAIAEDPSLAAILQQEARLEMLLRDAGAAATFCPACDELVRDERCDACGAAVRPGGYTIERVLVSNAHGRMYVARDADGTRVALKELAFVQSPSAAALAAFEREAKFLRALAHPAIPRFCASFEEGRGVHTRYYLAQQLVEGTALDQLDDHWYTESEIVDIAKQVLAILIYLQGLSPMVIHRDIKPANLLRRSDGTIALVDFGAAHVDGTTAGLTTIGTFGYMPIEQLAGIVDATTDLYALGATLLHLLTRQEPWRLAQTKAAVNVSAPLRAFLDKLVAQDPRDRFASAADALAALERRDALVVQPRRSSRSWRRPMMLAAAAVLAVVASGAGVFAVLRGRSSAPPAVMAPEELTYAKLRFHLTAHADAAVKLIINGQPIATVTDGFEMALKPGVYHMKLLANDGASCDEDRVTLTAGSTTTLDCWLSNPPAPIEPPPDLTAASAKLQFRLGGASMATLYVDGAMVATVTNTSTVGIRPGVRRVQLFGPKGTTTCDDRVTLEAGKTTTLECSFSTAP